MIEKDRRHETEMRVDETTSAPAQGSGPTEVKCGLPTQIQGAIGKQLRQVYGQMLSEPLPDKFSDLLNALGQSGKKE